ncbi:arsenate reductase/protein-tyrosine-phosphatase family protein [Cellulomonas persica]
MKLHHTRPSPDAWAPGWSGGSEPGEQIHPTAVTAMAERGIDISREYPRPWTDEIVRAADVSVTVGCDDACPRFPGKRYEDWQLDDPADLDLDDAGSATRSNARSTTFSTSSELKTQPSGPGARARLTGTMRA